MELADREQLLKSRCILIPGPVCSRTIAGSKGSEGRELLEGEVVSSMNPPEGCPFHPRCPYRQEECSRKVPELLPVMGDESHLAACPVMAREYAGKE